MGDQPVSGERGARELREKLAQVIIALLMLLTIMPMMMLSGGMTPIESQPAWLQPITQLLPSRHYMAFSQAIVFRGAGFEAVRDEFLAMAGLGVAFFGLSLILFRRSITLSR